MMNHRVSLISLSQSQAGDDWKNGCLLEYESLFHLHPAIHNTCGNTITRIYYSGWVFLRVTVPTHCSSG